VVEYYEKELNQRAEYIEYTKSYSVRYPHDELDIYIEITNQGVQKPYRTKINMEGPFPPGPFMNPDDTLEESYEGFPECTTKRTRGKVEECTAC